MPFAVVVQKPKGKVERERGDGVKIEKNGLGLVYTGVGGVGGTISSGTNMQTQETQTDVGTVMTPTKPLRPWERQ